MKIGFFTDGYLPQKNGVATSVYEYARALQNKGHEITIVAPKYPGYHDLQKNIVRLSSINYKKHLGVRLAVYLPEKAFRDLLKLDFDIIHGHGDGPVTMLGWTIAKRKKIPFVLSHHTFWNRYTHYLPAGKLIHPKMVEKFTQLFANSCNAIISPSHISKNELMQYGITKPINVIHHGLDLSQFTIKNKTYLRDKINIPKDHKILVYVGRLGREKSVDLLLHAFQTVYKKNNQTALVLIGDGTEKDNLIKKAHELGVENATFFLGEINYEDIPSALYSADIFVFASKTETLGKVVLEAMAAGLPTVTFNMAPYKELISNNKEGFLVRSSAQSFATAILKIVNDDTIREDMSKNARKKAKEFSIENAINKIENLYTENIEIYENRKRKGIITRVKNFLDVEFR